MSTKTTKTSKSAKSAKNTKTSKLERNADGALLNALAPLAKGAAALAVMKEIVKAEKVKAAKKAAEHKPNVAPALAVVKENKKAEKAAKEKPAQAAKEKPAKEKAETVASFMRRLIVEGKTNEEVFTEAVAKFGIGEEKKHYPSWYRCQLKRTAKVSAAPVKAEKEAAPEKNTKSKTVPKVAKVKTAGEPRVMTFMSTTKA